MQPWLCTHRVSCLQLLSQPCIGLPGSARSVPARPPYSIPAPAPGSRARRGPTHPSAPPELGTRPATRRRLPGATTGPSVGRAGGSETDMPPGPGSSAAVRPAFRPRELPVPRSFAPQVSAELHFPGSLETRLRLAPAHWEPRPWDE